MIKGLAPTAYQRFLSIPRVVPAIVANILAEYKYY